MRHETKLAALAAACVLAGAAALPAEAARRTRTAKTVLVSDARLRVKGKVVVRRQEATKKLPVREVLDLSLTKLDTTDTYSMWVDDPTDFTNDLIRIPPYEIVPKRNRTALVRMDGTAGGLPFEATLADLAEQRVQVRNGAGDIALTGTIPALRPRP